MKGAATASTQLRTGPASGAYELADHEATRYLKDAMRAGEVIEAAFDAIATWAILALSRLHRGLMRQRAVAGLDDAGLGGADLVHHELTRVFGDDAAE